MEYSDHASFLDAIDSDYFLDGFDGESGRPNQINRGPVNGYLYTAAASTNDLLFVDVHGSSDTPALTTCTIGPTIDITFTDNAVTTVGGFFFPTNLSGNPLTGTMTLDFNNGSIPSQTLSDAGV